MQRDRAKKAKAAAKRERRQGGGSAQASEDESVPPLDDAIEMLAPDEFLRRVEDLHRRYENKVIDFETFEEEKADLMKRVPVD